MFNMNPWQRQELALVMEWNRRWGGALEKTVLAFPSARRWHALELRFGVTTSQSLGFVVSKLGTKDLKLMEIKFEEGREEGRQEQREKRKESWGGEQGRKERQDGTGWDRTGQDRTGLAGQ